MMTGPGGMMSPRTAIAGDGPVGNLDDAERAATRFADRWGLAVGEVMQFDNGFYAELVDPSGDLATEVLVDPRTGGVQMECGPAMMWNTAYGIQPAHVGAPILDGEQAQTVADQWLDSHRPGEHTGDADAFPGYYTLHTLRGDHVLGMLSVNATTGAVWYHSWHGRFIAMNEHEWPAVVVPSTVADVLAGTTGWVIGLQAAGALAVLAGTGRIVPGSAIAVAGVMAAGAGITLDGHSPSS